MGKQKQEKVTAILNGLGQEELVEIIAEVAARDPIFRRSLLLKYDKGKQSEQVRNAKKLIKAIVKNYTGRDGFIPSRFAGGFVNEMLSLLGTPAAERFNETELEIALLVLEEGVQAFQYADDSGGDIGMLVRAALKRIGDLAEGSDHQNLSARERCLERLLAVSGSGIFEGFEDYRVALLHICAEFADAPKLRERLIAALEQQIALLGNREYKQYTVEELHQLLFQLIRKYGTAEEAEHYVQKHLRLTYFRQWAIKDGMESGDYRLAAQLAEQGERQDERYPGLVIQWKRARYEAYKQLSLRQEQMALAKELLMEGEFAYYRELESLWEGDREECYRGILAELKETDSWRLREVYLKLISSKNDLAEMMAYVQAKPSAIEEYASRLSAHYPEEIRQIYKEQVHQAAAAASNRKEYKRVCALLKRYGAIMGHDSRSELILQLKTMYAKRPALLDELAKLA